MKAIDTSHSGMDAAVPPDQPTIRAAQEHSGDQHRRKVEEAAEQFEAFFISHMLEQMRQSTRAMSSEDSVFNNRVNQDMMDLADTQLAQTLSKQRAFGIADAILRQLLPASPTAPELKQTSAPVASGE